MAFDAHSLPRPPSPLYLTQGSPLLSLPPPCALCSIAHSFWVCSVLEATFYAPFLDLSKSYVHEKKHRSCCLCFVFIHYQLLGLNEVLYLLAFRNMWGKLWNGTIIMYISPYRCLHKWTLSIMTSFACFFASTFKKWIVFNIFRSSWSFTCLLCKT